jgi:hypothetical protein
LVERQPSKLEVAGSNPVSRSIPSRPAAFCFGRAHVVTHGNEALLERWRVRRSARSRSAGRTSAQGVRLMDTVLDRGKALAAWIRLDDEDWRLTVAPRVDPETQEVYGVTIYLRAGSDSAVT